MTNPSKTLIAALLDRTGSMSGCRKATEDGFNELINGQKQEPGECRVTLAQFDKHGTAPILTRTYSNMPIHQVPLLSLHPRGMTPLWDATGQFVTEIGDGLAALPEEDRPGLVICLIMTDGNENASTDWTPSRVKELIERQRNQWNWKFMFIGANIDAQEVGASMGIDRGSSMAFNSHNYAGTQAAYAAPGIYTSAMRGQAMAGAPVMDAAFTDEDRNKAMGEGKKSKTSS